MNKISKYLIGNKLRIPEKLLMHTHSQLKFTLIDRSKKKSWEVISNHLSDYYFKEFKEKHADLFHIFNSIGIGLSAASIERALKGEKGVKRITIKYELLDYLCYAVWGKSLAEKVLDINVEWGKNTNHDIIVIIPDYARPAIDKYIKNEEVNDNAKNKKQEEEVTPYNIKQFDTSNGNYYILVLPFTNPEKDNEVTSLGRNLTDRLIEKNDLQKLGLEIKYLPSPIEKITHREAKKLGNNYKADMVIWGIDSKPNNYSPHIIYFHYVNLAKKVYSEKIKSEGKTEKFETERLVEITEGDMQLELDDIIYWFLGNKLYTSNNYTKALDLFKKIKNKKYINTDLFFIISNCYYSLNSYNKTKSYLEKILEIDPNDLIAHNNYATLLTQMFNDLEKAQKHYEIALIINPYSAETHYNYAVFLSQNLKNKEDAKKHYEKALDLEPNYVAAHNNYAGLLLEEFNDIIGAKKHYEKVLVINPNCAEFHYNYAFLLGYYLNKLKESKEHFEKALEIRPDYFEANHDYAILLSEKFQDIESAKKHFEKNIVINPNCAMFHYSYATFLALRYDDFEDAKKHYEKALELDPNYFEAHNNYAGLLLEGYNDTIGAKKHFEKALVINQNNAELNYNYAILLGQAFNNTNGAKAHYKKALEINPSNAEFHYKYAVFLWEELNKTKKAKLHFEKAISIKEDYAEAHNYYAILLLNKFNSLNEGRLHYLKAIKLNPKFKTKEKDEYFDVK